MLILPPSVAADKQVLADWVEFLTLSHEFQIFRINNLHRYCDESQDNENTETSSSEKPDKDKSSDSFSEEQILEHLKTVLTEKTLECAVLERNTPGTSKYRTVDQQELHSLLPLLNQTTN